MTNYALPEDTRDEIRRLCKIRSPVWSPEYYIRNLRDIDAMLVKLAEVTPARKRKPK